MNFVFGVDKLFLHNGKPAADEYDNHRIVIYPQKSSRLLGVYCLARELFFTFL